MTERRWTVRRELDDETRALIAEMHDRHPAPCELFTKKFGRCTCEETR